MKRYDLVIAGGTVVLPGGEVRVVDIGVRDGRIAALAAEGLGPEADRVIDARGRTVMPGAIDQHFHVFLGYPWDTYENATRGALRGGVTTVVDMPLDNPPTLTVEALNKKKAVAAKGSCVDYALYGGYIPDDPEEMGRLAAGGVGAYKLFTDATAPPGMYPGVDAGQQLEAMRLIAGLGGTASVHCENSFMIDVLTKRYKAAGRSDPGVWDDARPVFAEEDAARRTVLLAEETGCRTVIAHASVPGVAGMVQAARDRGHEVYTETCPHYLLLTRDDLAKDARLKYNPPNRGKAYVDGLWEALKRGLVHAVGSDHAPLPKDPRADIWGMSPGAGDAVETMLPLVLTEGVERRGIPLARMVDLFTTNPAKTFGLYPRKGCISIGSDADFTILETGGRRKIDARDLCMLGDRWSPFDGWTVSVFPVMAIVRGRLAMENGKVLVEPGFGEFLAV